jgi:hypothetical protein
MIPKHLEKRVEHFLSTLRLGLVYGEVAGGLALVHGQKILRSEAFLDLHDMSHENRAILRRARRNRTSRKMRLAHLRSWILRQRLPTGSRLPDPYKIMWDPVFQAPPGSFRATGRPPTEYPTWIEEAMEGRAEPEGFVCALTHLFRNRGRSFEESVFPGKTDLELFKLREYARKLRARKPRKSPHGKRARKRTAFAGRQATKEQLENARSQKARELLPRLEEEIARRAKAFPARACEFNSHESLVKRIPPKALAEDVTEGFDKLTLEAEALGRGRVTRAAREAQLRGAVEAFCRAQGMQEAAVSRWQQELAGLLNGTSRPLRNKNRRRSQCPFCNRMRPLQGSLRLRRAELRLLLEQLRALTCGFSAQQAMTLLKTWEDLQRCGLTVAGSPPIEECDSEHNKNELLRRLREMGLVDERGEAAAALSDEAMRKYEQVKRRLFSVPPPGRARLCTHHVLLGLGRKLGRNHGMKWELNPGRSTDVPEIRQHDARLMRRIEDFLFFRGKTGEAAWRWRDDQGRPLPLGCITVALPPDQTRKRPATAVDPFWMRSLEDQLLKENGGPCLFQQTRACRSRSGFMEAGQRKFEQIVPAAKGGPAARVNLTAICADCSEARAAKGENSCGRLPAAWITDPEEWNRFATRVGSSTTLPDFKKNLLLLPREGLFPDDMAITQHASRRWRKLARNVVSLFRRFGVPAPQIDFAEGVSHLQRVNLRWVASLRHHWGFKDRERKEKNFPALDYYDLKDARTFAQSAALLAALPPRRWRAQILADEAVRPAEASGRGISDEQRPRPGIALLDLAPDWAEFTSRWKGPLVHVMDNARMTWSRQLTGLSQYANPENLEDLRIRRLQSTGPEFAPGLPRRSGAVPKSGLVIQIPYFDPPTRSVRLRKVQLRPVSSSGALIWLDTRKRFQISLIRPAPLHRFLPAVIEPPLGPGHSVVLRLKRHALLRYDDTRFARIQELTKNFIVAVPEYQMPFALLEKVAVHANNAFLIEWRIRRAGKRPLPEKNKADIPGRIEYKFGRRWFATHFLPGPSRKRSRSKKDDCPF